MPDTRERTEGRHLISNILQPKQTSRCALEPAPQPHILLDLHDRPPLSFDPPGKCTVPQIHVNAASRGEIALYELQTRLGKKEALHGQVSKDAARRWCFHLTLAKSRIDKVAMEQARAREICMVDLRDPDKCSARVEGPSRPSNQRSLGRAAAAHARMHKSQPDPVGRKIDWSIVR